MGHPALVLAPVLVPAVNAGLAENHCPQAERAAVVVHVLVGRALGAPVRSAEVERLILGDRPVEILGLPVDLVGGGENHRRLGCSSANRLQDVERARQVDGKVAERVRQGGGNRDLRRQV